MDRFGRSNFRGARARSRPFGARPGSTPRSGNPGSGPSFRSPNQYGSVGRNNIQSRDWSAPRSTSTGSLLGQPSKRTGTTQYGGGLYNNSDSTALRQGLRQPNQPLNPSVPAEVRQLMQTLGLSRSDMEKLSQLPENQLSSVSNLSRALSNLRKEKQRGYASEYDPADPTSVSDPDRLYGRNSRNSYPEEDTGAGSFYDRRDGASGIGQSVQRRSFPGTLRQRTANSDMMDPNRQYQASANRHQPTGIKVTVKPSQHLGPRLGSSDFYDSQSNDDYPSQRNDRGYTGNEYVDEKRFRGLGKPADLYQQQRNDSFADRSGRLSNKNISQREESQKSLAYNERSAPARNRSSDRAGTTASRMLPKPVGTRNAPNPSGTGILQNPPQRGLLGNPLQPNVRGLESLAASVGRTSTSNTRSVNQTSLLNPLILAAQTDPNMLEAQIKAMQAIQAQAIKMQEKSSIHDVPRARNEDKPRRRSSPSRGGGIDRRLEEEARKEAQEMRTMRGRVLYIRYKSARIEEADLRQLATAFGKVTNVLIIQPKIRNGHFQAFMEMEQWDCAAAMLEHYMSRSANIRGCPIEVQRSNYKDLQIRSDQMNKERGAKKRRRSMSPIRRGTTQVSDRRERRSAEKKPNEKPKLQSRRSSENLNVSISANSKTDRRVVKRSNENLKTGDSKEISAAGVKTVAKKPDPKTVDNKKVDAREILNQSRGKDNRRDSTTRDNQRRSNEQRDAPGENKGRKRSSPNVRRSLRSNDEPKEKVKRGNSEKDERSNIGEKTTNEMKDTSDNKDSSQNKEKDQEKLTTVGESEKNKEEIDPLDEIADELALHDEFVLMDEVGYEGEQKKNNTEMLDDKESCENTKAEEQKNDLGMDLERPDLDLEDVNVEVMQDEDGRKESEDYDKNDISLERMESNELGENEGDQEQNNIETIEDADVKKNAEDNENAAPVNNDEKNSASVEQSEMKQHVVLISSKIEEPSEICAEAEEKMDVEDNVHKNAEVTNQIMSVGDSPVDKEELTEDKTNTENSEHTELQEVETEKESTSEKCEDVPASEPEDNVQSSQEELTQLDSDINRQESDEECSTLGEPKVNELQSIITDTLSEVMTAKGHLLSLTKVTKNRAAQAVAKKLKVCLEVAITRLESAEST